MFKICGLFVLGFTMLLMSCSEADTMGDEPPDEIVIEGTPTWENGIGELVELNAEGGTKWRDPGISQGGLHWNQD